MSSQAPVKIRQVRDLQRSELVCETRYPSAGVLLPQRSLTGLHLLHQQPLHIEESAKSHLLQPKPRSESLTSGTLPKKTEVSGNRQDPGVNANLPVQNSPCELEEDETILDHVNQWHSTSAYPRKPRMEHIRIWVCCIPRCGNPLAHSAIRSHIEEKHELSELKEAFVELCNENYRQAIEDDVRQARSAQHDAHREGPQGAGGMQLHDLSDDASRCAKNSAAGAGPAGGVGTVQFHPSIWIQDHHERLHAVDEL
mmetsp:Transcript_42248/g.99202  ORF Transcript_42248/g.99202 Transcript_42248/m.99202 type:complete len:254 (-) Transcript_42248:498-1259(-)